MQYLYIPQDACVIAWKNAKIIVRNVDASKRCLCAVVKFLTAGNVTAIKICCRMQNAYGAEYISRR